MGACEAQGLGMGRAPAGCRVWRVAQKKSCPGQRFHGARPCLPCPAAGSSCCHGRRNICGGAPVPHVLPGGRAAGWGPCCEPPLACSTCLRSVVPAWAGAAVLGPHRRSFCRPHPAPPLPVPRGQATGYGGTVIEGKAVEDKIRRREQSPDAAVEAAAAARQVTVYFNSDVAGGAPPPACTPVRGVHAGGPRRRCRKGRPGVARLPRSTGPAPRAPFCTSATARL